MSNEIRLPNLGEGPGSAGVVSVLVKVGDDIAADQSILEVETEKATVEVPSPQAGKVVEIHVKPGQVIHSHDLLMTVEAAASPESRTANRESQQPAPQKENSEPPKTNTESMPKPEARLPNETQSPKAETSATVPVSQADADSVPIRDSQFATRDSAPPAFLPESELPAGPATRRLARELGVDLTAVKGTGDGGRITQEDVTAAAKAVNLESRTATRETGPNDETRMTNEARSPKPERESAGTARPDFIRSSQFAARDTRHAIRRERMTMIRRAIADKVSESVKNIPHVTNFDDADITDLEAFRKTQKESLASQGIKLTLMPFVIKAVTDVLKLHPLLNASVDMQAGEIVYKEDINIGVAVDTPRGLVVPVIRGAAGMNIAQLAGALASLSQAMRANSFGMDALRDGTFTISNLGAIGGTYSTPIIRYPESAILLVGKARLLPKAMEHAGEGGDVCPGVRVRLMLPLSLSYDHRIIDGAEAARAMNDLIEYLESPGRLLLT